MTPLTSISFSHSVILSHRKSIEASPFWNNSIGNRESYDERKKARCEKHLASGVLLRSEDEKISLAKSEVFLSKMIFLCAVLGGFVYLVIGSGTDHNHKHF